MAHPHRADARRSHGDKLNRMTGKRGEYPPDRAERIGKAGRGQPAQGDAAQPPAETFIAAPARQVSDKGKVRGG